MPNKPLDEDNTKKMTRKQSTAKQCVIEHQNSREEHARST